MSAVVSTRPEDADRRMGFVLALRQAGALDRRVLATLERLDRQAFAPAAFRAISAFGDVALPLDGGQTMTRPSTVARVLEAAALTPSMRVLEVGTGSGYQTAALAALSRVVTSLERIAVLAGGAQRALDAIGAPVIVRHADGLAEGPSDAEDPFDVVIVNAGLALPPSALLARVRPGGALIAPFGDGAEQRLVRLTLDDGARFSADDLGPVRYPPAERGLS